MNESLNRPLLIGIALIQGLLLFWLKQTLIDEAWPKDIRVAETLLWSLALAVPTLLLLSLNRINAKRMFIGAAVFALVVALIASYVGWQLEPNEKIRAGSISAVYAFTLAILLFKVVMYLQIWAEQKSFTYAQLFQYSWRNTLLVGICLLFVLVFWGILFLWGQLFEVVGIDFFEDLFEEDWFLFPALAIANGFAFTIFRKLVNIVDTMSRVLQAICQFLLPLLIFVSLLFLVFLPFVGFSALWDTGKGTAMVLWLQALTLFFFNATYQDETHPSPYWQALQKFVSLGILVLPIYSVIAMYGIALRVDQYGLTVARCWAILVIGVWALFAFGYAINLLWKRTEAGKYFGWINVRIGLVVLALMVLVNSPLLDFRKISVSSQLNMLENGELTIEEFDFRYFARQSGRAGYLALEEMKIGADQATLDRIEGAYYYYGQDTRELTAEQIAEKLYIYPADANLPDDLREQIVEQVNNSLSAGKFFVIHIDMNGDGEEEWVSISPSTYNYTSAFLWIHTDGEWHMRYLSSTNNIDAQTLDELFEAGDVAVEEPVWKVLRIGELRIWNSQMTIPVPPIKESPDSSD